ncbi:MAG: RNA-binding protein [Fibromonadaceae bacterium]|jgi:RNA recognition motif-containing protein|nr:RNA-binding protein [Fibromonadaceae bacterium]
MSKSIYVGNLPFAFGNEQLGELFAEFGEVKSAKVVIDRNSNRSKGFGFVEMDEEVADKAIQALNGKNVGNRPLRVNESQPREQRPPRQDNRDNRRR